MDRIGNMKLASLCLAVVASAVPSLGRFGVSPVPQPPLDMAGNGFGGAIVGGDPLSPGDRPYLVTIGGPLVDSPSGYFCGGTLITAFAVLSSATCFTVQGEFEPQGWVDVKRYSLTDDTGVQRFPLCETLGGGGCDLSSLAYVKIHPDFNSETFENDYAVIILPALVHDVEPVMLNDDVDFPVVGADLLVSGWGYQGFTVPPFSDIPLEATVNYISNEGCSTIYNGIISISDVLMCAGTNDRGSCNGDSGGPLIADTVDGPVQVGVGSFGFCGMLGYPGAYGRVSTGYAWIMSATQTDSPTSSPTASPTSSPVTTKPSLSPTSKPTDSPTSDPTSSPSSKPTDSPTSRPTSPPTSKPTDSPTSKPTDSPTSKPTDSPTSKPTSSPVTSGPTSSPVTSGPTSSPSSKPTSSPSSKPTSSPVTSGPTLFPTSPPTVKPTTDAVTDPGPSPTPTPGECPADKDAECLADNVAKRLAELDAVPSFEVVMNNNVYQCERGDLVDAGSQDRRLNARGRHRRLDDRFDDRLGDRFLDEIDARDLDRLAERLAARVGRSKRAGERRRASHNYYY